MADEPTYLSIECRKTEMAIEEAISEATGKPPMFGLP
jgi:hypothetical protein